MMVPHAQDVVGKKCTVIGQRATVVVSRVTVICQRLTAIGHCVSISGISKISLLL